MARSRARSPRRSKGDRGTSVLETSVVTILAAGIVIAVVQSPVGDYFHDSVREMVCVVDGPECGGETWTEVERPEPPEEYRFNLTGLEWTGEVTGTGKAVAAIEWALQHASMNTPYVWGANGPNAFDCSSFVQWAWRQAGVSLPRVTYQQQPALPAVPSIDQLQPGDLVFFNTNAPGPPPTHVGMYIGDGSFVHAANSRRGVVVDSLSGYYLSAYAGAGRPPQE
ncbi:C40 family peptidase [Thermobifida halotolerans]|uniref:C40 family peptidase n=1 Tax=Thermobifida halotolerans TaxID=483545 RepID=A0A399G3K3_9ACTN|nr:C40 family peptidase [Thermobifida halotolerans]UOE18005.1 C40 family peptidase [Thermobifida halotolerans]